MKKFNEHDRVNVCVNCGNTHNGDYCDRCYCRCHVRMSLPRARMIIALNAFNDPMNEIDLHGYIDTELIKSAEVI